MEMDKMKKEMARLQQHMAATATPAPAGGGVSKPKLRSFRGVKFLGRKEDFEAFRTTYDAAHTLDAGEFVGWGEKDKVAYLVSAVEGKALEVVRASIALHKNILRYELVWKDFEEAYRDSAEGE